MLFCKCKSKSKKIYISDQDEGTKETPTERPGIVCTTIVEIDEELPVHPKVPEDELLIRKGIENNDFISEIITKDRLDNVVAAMYKRPVKANEIVIREGEKGNHMYISAGGKFSIMKQRKLVGTFQDVRVFGELAILYNAKRLATIKAVTSGSVWVLDNNVYQLILYQYNLKRYGEIASFLKRTAVLRDVGDDGLRKIANTLRSEFFEEGHEIVRQGDQGEKFYIINAGSVTVTKRGEGVVGILTKGDSFGELALTEEICRQATVTANSPGVECLTLTRKEFTELIDYIKLRPKHSLKPTAEYEDIQLSDLEWKKTLGIGGFSRVELVLYKKNRKLVFALKHVKKYEIVQQMQQEHIINERTIQMSSKSPFILRLYRTYRDDRCVFFLMESCLGGDLWHLLYKWRPARFEEKDAMFYIACVIEAIAFLHSREIIFRDLKPENLLIASNGYLKLSDFGLAKKLKKGDRTSTFAGTHEYLPPEIVLRQDYNTAVDCWQLGIFLFELLCKRTPFRVVGDDENHLRTCENIVGGIDKVDYPSYMDMKAVQLVKKLCRKDPMERLGMGPDGIQEIRTHKWFTGFNWEQLGAFQMKPPFVPKLSGPLDTRYIPDIYEKDVYYAPAENSGWDEDFDS
ncbi:hypothetical protein JTB14_027923 [Gonioctena quinquepunctata]|nr:hypothetical protein JTB14_027923 [Gonioctena quinquepunctata]